MSEIATPSLVQISLPMIYLTALINGVCLGMIQSITILSNRPEFQHRKSFRLQLSVPVFPRLLRDSHLDLEIETLKENSHLILDLNSQFFSENSHSHSQFSLSNSRKYENGDL